MKIIVVGCGRLGAELAYRLFQRGHDIAIIDQRATAFANLPADFSGRVNEGDALNQDVLHRAGIRQADGLAAVTSSDAINMVIGHVANKIYKVPIVVARNFIPYCRPIFEVFGLQTVAATSWGAQRLEEILYNTDVRTIFSAGNGEVELYELAVPASCGNITMADLMKLKGCVIASTSRAGRASLPAPEMSVEVGDVLHVSATFDGMQSLRKHLNICDLEE